MADKKISELVDGYPALSTDKVPVARAGSDQSLTTQELTERPGKNIVHLPTLNNVSMPGSVYSHCGINAGSCLQGISASAIQSTPAKWKVSVLVAVGPMNVTHFVIARTLPNDLNVIDFTPITFGGSASPTLATGVNTSDAISLQIDTTHDYWFLVYGPSQTNFYFTANAQNMNNGLVDAFFAGQAPSIPGDITAITPIVPAVSSGSVMGSWIVNWQAA
jgi:hypothetical protein